MKGSPEMVRSGYLMSNVLELRPDSLTVLLIHWAYTTVITMKMLGQDVVLVLLEPSDFKEAMPLVDVWRSATIISGGQCVMTNGHSRCPSGMWTAGIPHNRCVIKGMNGEERKGRKEKKGGKGEKKGGLGGREEN